MRERVQSIVRELVASDDVNDALLSVQEMGAANVDERLVEEAFMQALDMKKDAQRAALSRLLLALHQRGALSSEHVERAVERLLPAMDDIAIDLPHCEDHVALLLALLTLGGAVRLSFLRPSLLSALSHENPAAAPRFFLAVLQSIKRHGSEERLVDLVTTAQREGLDLQASLDKPKADVARKFLAEKKLDALAQLL